MWFRKMRTALAVTAASALGLAVVALATSAGASTTGPSPAPTPSSESLMLNPQQWTRGDEQQKESSLSAMIALYKIGWVHGYLSRSQRDAQALLPKDEPVFARPIAVYVQELTAYYKSSSSHIAFASAVSCLASNLTQSEIATCGSDFPFNK